MVNDKMIKDAVRAFDEKVGEPNSYKAILYVCLEGGAEELIYEAALQDDDADSCEEITITGGAADNDFAIMTVSDFHICFYVLEPIRRGPVIWTRVVLPFEKILSVRVRKFLLFNTFKVNCAYSSEMFKLSIKISEKVLGIKEQKENIRIFQDILRARKHPV